MKPIIGIPVCHYDRECINIKAVWSNFVEIIEDLGGIALIIPSVRNIDYYLNQIHGLLLAGGRDIYPPNFSIKSHEKSGPFDLVRDEIELKSLEYAIKTNKPVLGICRGAQLIAAYHGSEIIQDLQEPYAKHTHWTVPEKFEYMHTVDVEKDTFLYECSKKVKWPVNSGHHQGIKSLGHGLRMVAKSPDGLIEAFQHEKHNYMLGVQWHPEVLGRKDHHYKIFEQFISKCRKELI